MLTSRKPHYTGSRCTARKPHGSPAIALWHKQLLHLSRLIWHLLRTMQLHSIAKPIHTAHTYSYVAYMSYGTGRSIYVLPDSCAGRGAGVWAQLNGWQENDPDWRSDVPLQPMYMHWLTLCASLCLFVYLCASMCYTYIGRCRYNGGPGANTAMHSLAAMVPKLRRAAGSYGASVSLCVSVCLCVSLCVSLCLSVSLCVSLCVLERLVCTSATY